MKKNYLLFLLIFLSIAMLSKGAENKDSLKWSKEFNLGNAEEIIGIVGYDASATYLLKRDYSEILEKYDTEYNLTAKLRLKIHKGLRSRNLEKVIFFHDSIYMFISEYRFRKTNLYVQRIDKQTLKPVGLESLLYSSSNVKGNYPDFVINYSLQRSKLLITATTELMIQKTKIFEYLVFTTGMEKLWYRKDLYIYNHQPPKNITFTVDETGNVYLFALIYEVKWLEHFSQELKAQYIVVGYSNKGETRNHQVFDMNNKYPRGASLIACPDGTFIFAGLVSNNFQYGVSGIFYQAIDPLNGHLRPLRITNFDMDFLKELNKGELIKDDELYGYSFKNLVLRANGTVVLLAEQIFDQDYDNNNHILAFGINNFGDVIWNQVIRKKQTGNTNVSFSLVAPVNQNNVKVIYNESAVNPLENQTIDRRSFFYLDDSYLCMREIDNRGFIISDSLAFRNHKEPAFEPKFTYDNQKGEILMIATRYKKFRFLRLTLFPVKE